MDDIRLCDSNIAREGLSRMLDCVIGPHEYICAWVPVERALLILEIAKRVKDEPMWFPRGKWATIQFIENDINEQLKQFNGAEEPKQPNIGGGD